METTLALHGQSPLIPLDLILQSLAQASVSGSIRAIAADGSKFRLVFVTGRVAFAQSNRSREAVAVVRHLLAQPTTWGFEPHDVQALSGARPIDVQAVLMEVARLNDEAARETHGVCGC